MKHEGFDRLKALKTSKHVGLGGRPVYYTPGKINMEPENTVPEKEKHLPNHHFQC